MCNVTVFQSAVDHIYDDGLIDCNRAEFLGRNENMWYKRNFSSFDGSSICGAWQRFFLTRSTSIFECTKDIPNCHWPVSGRGACLLKCCVFRGCSPPPCLAWWSSELHCYKFFVGDPRSCVRTEVHRSYLNHDEVPLPFNTKAFVVVWRQPVPVC